MNFDLEYTKVHVRAHTTAAQIDRSSRECWLLLGHAPSMAQHAGLQEHLVDLKPLDISKPLTSRLTVSLAGSCRDDCHKNRMSSALALRSMRVSISPERVEPMMTAEGFRRLVKCWLGEPFLR